MYACITGKVLEKQNTYVVIETAGIGYMIACSHLTQDKLYVAQEQAMLFLEPWVREHEIRLYGFATQRERDWFRLLISTQGVGAKHAMSLLSIFEPQDLFQLIIEKNDALLTQADGVGPKLAKRIIVELFEKVSKMEEYALSDASNTQAPRVQTTTYTQVQQQAQRRQELQDALKSLGYDVAISKKIASETMQALGGDVDIQELIKYALKEISR